MSSFAFANGGNGHASPEKKTTTYLADEVALSLGESPVQKESVPSEQTTEIRSSRIYHGEHFAHGVYLGGAAAAEGPAGDRTYTKQSTTLTALGQPIANGTGTDLSPAPSLRVQLTGIKGGQSVPVSTGGDNQVIPGSLVQIPYPMPKWPQNHTSAAFEAIAVKKSYILSPPEIYAECAHHGEEKSKWPSYKFLFLSIVAGCYVSFGYTTCLQIGGLLDQAPSNTNSDEVNLGMFKLIFGAVGFPFGFATIIICGGELYTSICAYTAAAWWEGKITALNSLRLLVLSWCGNFAGCAIMVGLLYAAQIFNHKDEYLVYIAQDKIHYGWGAVFVKGIMANWLVGIATWMANSAQDLTGKFVGIWLPISAFAAIGFEHCIANQFLFPMAMSHGAAVNAYDLVVKNLIPATLGNWVGGAVCISTTYAMIYGRTPLRVIAWWERTVEPYLPWSKKNK
mmetsp:Transcript_8744/g.18647  ORF Transcript_8744/g.18647 Transcript_8744/m.18647 type:complete len:452 (+) Transcript_8744:184-1539(+)|eukprot:CAMPEP_0202922824 /NCGR_PEP_ID=MMETSP1392-20130828/78119_1 /ASSEMBLY_ACC=CAM_ASM_000868 /TAXON_ID=225041 /ORGANISM="Chlamydomonas chlamydogama, Strain SAG 11-48b" /LENGTH=451 /DNA_ID=CAMNT_0049616473 /DNA_START=170 /DNA_END=1525 /DNA_ORIENTATION=-